MNGFRPRHLPSVAKFDDHASHFHLAPVGQNMTILHSKPVGRIRKAIVGRRTTLQRSISNFRSSDSTENHLLGYPEPFGDLGGCQPLLQIESAYFHHVQPLDSYDKCYEIENENLVRAMADSLQFFSRKGKKFLYLLTSNISSQAFASNAVFFSQ
jgi:hypothetical protein